MSNTFRKTASASALALAVLASGATSANAAFVPPAQLKYDCKYPLVDKKPLTIDITSNIPTIAKYDTLQPKFLVDAVATAGGGTAEAIDTLDAQFIEGVSEARASLVYRSTGYEQKNLKVPLTVDRWTKPANFKITDDLVLGAKGSTPAVTLDEYGKVDIRVDTISLNLKAFYADNSPIDVKKLKTNYEGVAVNDSDGDPFTFDVYCKLLPETSNIIATICVNDTGLPDASCPEIGANQPPAKVTGLKVDAQDASSATLSWGASADPDAGDTVKYDVFRGTTKVATAISATTFKDTGLAAGTYSYTVVASDGKAGGTAAASDALPVTIAAANQAPAKVTGLKLDTKDASSATISWGASVDPDGDAVKYDVLRGTTKVATAISATSFKDTPLAAGTYSYTVVASDGKAGGTAAASDALSVTIDVVEPENQAPAKVTGLKLDTKDASSATISWGASVDPDGDAVTYDVLRGTTKVATAISATSFKDSPLAAGTYSYTVVASDGEDAAADSDALSVVIEAVEPENQAPAKVTGLKLDTKDASSATISWGASVDPDGDAVKYDVLRGTTKVATAISATSFKDTPLAAGTYSYTVVASDGEDAAAASDALSVVIEAVEPENQAPAKVTGLKLDTKDASSATISWGASVDPDGDAVKYDVLRGTTKVATAISATSFKDTPLAAGTYSYTVVASDGEDAAAASDALSVVIESTGTCPQGLACYNYAAKGKTTLKTLTTGNLPLVGEIKAQLKIADGSFNADLTLANTTGRLVAAGFLPITAKVGFAPFGKTTGQLDDADATQFQRITTKSLVRIKVLEVKLFGAIPLAGGNNCQTKQLSEINLKSTNAFDPLKGGSIGGTYKISDLNGCGPLNGLVSPLTAGGGNTIALDLTRKP